MKSRTGFNIDNRATVRRPYLNGVDVTLTDGTKIEIRWGMNNNLRDDLRIDVETGSQIRYSQTTTQKRKVKR